jgi:hypothetical protein
MGRKRALVATLFPLALAHGVACDDRVSLGSWQAAVSGGGGAAGGGSATGGASIGEQAGSAGEDDGATATLCGSGGDAGSLEPGGSAVGVTVTYTDWTWPATFDSLEWELGVESEFDRDGYFWAHRFAFVGGPTGFVGIQARGGYQAEPPDGFIDVTNMVVFWISSSPLRAELGDVPYPDARTYLTSESGSEWWTIHARYDWDACKTYQFRVGPQATESSGDVWYGAWVRDRATSVETYIGRILVPAAWGKLESSSMWSTRIGYAPLGSCRDPEPASALFGIPTADGGTLRPSSHTNRLAEPRECGTSRVTDFRNGVRQEIGLPPN